jgi:hypothetical protein
MVCYYIRTGLHHVPFFFCIAPCLHYLMKFSFALDHIAVLMAIGCDHFTQMNVMCPNNLRRYLANDRIPLMHSHHAYVRRWRLMGANANQGRDGWREPTWFQTLSVAYACMRWYTVCSCKIFSINQMTRGEHIILVTLFLRGEFCQAPLIGCSKEIAVTCI